MTSQCLSWFPSIRGIRTARQVNTSLVFVCLGTISVKSKNRHEVAIDKIRFSQASGDVHSIQLVVVKSQPFLKIPETAQRVVSGDVSTGFIICGPA